MQPPISTRVGNQAPAPLTTLAAAKIELGIDPTDTTNDAFLTRAIQQVSAGIAGECHRSFGLVNWSDLFMGRPRGWCDDVLAALPGPLQLGNWPIGSIASLTETCGQVATPLDPATDFQLEPNTGHLWRLDAFGNRRPWDADQVLVLYSAGETASESYVVAGADPTFDYGNVENTGLLFGVM